MSTSDNLRDTLGGRWQAGTGAGAPLFDPVLGIELARVDSTGLDLIAGFDFAREQGGRALRAMGYRPRRLELACRRPVDVVVLAEGADGLDVRGLLALLRSARRAPGGTAVKSIT